MQFTWGYVMLEIRRLKLCAMVIGMVTMLRAKPIVKQYHVIHYC